MAEPKKKQTKVRTKRRRHALRAQIPKGVKCRNCQTIIKRHEVCPECGYYKGEKIL